jgi:hypothetical protein
VLVQLAFLVVIKMKTFTGTKMFEFHQTLQLLGAIDILMHCIPDLDVTEDYLIVTNLKVSNIFFRLVSL